MSKKMTRREFLCVGAGVAGAAVLSACAPAVTTTPGQKAQSTAAPAPAANTNALGVQLPADALPSDQQVWRGAYSYLEGKYNDYMRSLYDRIGSPWWGQERLLNVDSDWAVMPSGATEWKVADDKLTWTFKLRPGLQFSDGHPITASDWEWTLKYALNGAERQYDFAWYWDGVVKGSSNVIAGKAPADQLGIKALDDNTLQIVTEKPVPYFPQLVTMFYLSPGHVIQKEGEFWSVNPATYVSSGPWMLKAYERGKQLMWALNQSYKGIYRPYLTQSIVGFRTSQEQSAALASYLNNEVNEHMLGGYSAVASPADMEMMKSNPRLKAEGHPKPEPVTYYMGFNSIDSKWPFKDNLKLRQAFAYAVDVPSLVKAVIPDLAIPAASMLPPGFVGAKPDLFKSIHPYDPAKAKQLMADAGYPDGKGFPTLTLWVRDPSTAVSALAQAIQKQLETNLNIKLELRPADYKTFTDNLKHEAPLYIVPYGMDFMDQSNLLGIWKSSGRHPWKNDTFDAQLDEASSFFGAAAERNTKFEAVEKILVEDVAAIFLFHPLTIWLYPARLKGDLLKQNKSGLFTGIAYYLENAYFSK